MSVTKLDQKQDTDYSVNPHESKLLLSSWSFDLAVIGLSVVLVGLFATSMLGVWSPWEAQIARSLEYMSTTQGWLTVHVMNDIGQTFESAPILPFGWLLNALCYQLFPNEFGLRLPQVILVSLCALMLYSATRFILLTLGVQHERRGAYLATSLWFVTPAISLGSLFSLGGVGTLYVTLASLWWLTPFALKKIGIWIGVLLWLISSLSLGLFGMILPLMTLWVVGDLHDSKEFNLSSFKRPLSLMVLGIGLALWRLSMKNIYLLEGDWKQWLELCVLHMSPFGSFKYSTYGGFQDVTHILAYSIFPVGLMMPSVLIDLFTREGASVSFGYKRLGSLLSVWFGVVFLAMALNQAWANGSGELAPLLVVPAVIGCSVYLSKALIRPSLILHLTIILLMILILSDFKQDSSLFLTPLIGEQVEGLDERFRSWRPMVILGYIGVMILLITLFPKGWWYQAQAHLKPLKNLQEKHLMAVGRSLISLWSFGLLGAAITLMIGLSSHLSKRDLIDSYHRYSIPDEPLVLYGITQQQAAHSYYLRRLEEAPREALKQAAESEDRIFMIIKRSELSALNKSFRKASGKHLTILDDSSHELLLASNLLRSGEHDLNPIGSAVIEKLPKGIQKLKTPFVFEDKVELIGWSIEPGALKAGSEARLKLYWKALKTLKRSWKIFVHIDASNQRIHADHEPVEGLYPTRDWKPGDLIQDIHPFQVKSSISSDIFKIHVGLYQGKTRLKIKQGPEHQIGKDDRALIGRVRVY